MTCCPHPLPVITDAAVHCLRCPAVRPRMSQRPEMAALAEKLRGTA